MEVLRDGLTVVEVADRDGVSRQAVHGWLRRYAAGSLDALADRSHRPRHCPHQMPAEVEAHLCELRRRPAGLSRPTPRRPSRHRAAAPITGTKPKSINRN
jgi:transposase